MSTPVCAPGTVLFLDVLLAVASLLHSICRRLLKPCFGGVQSMGASLEYIGTGKPKERSPGTGSNHLQSMSELAAQ